MFRDVEVKEGVKEEARNLEKVKKPKVDKIFVNWLPAYMNLYGWCSPSAAR